MCSSGLVPRRMALLGLVAGSRAPARSFGWWEEGSTVPAILVIREFFWELSLDIYVAVWGFRRDAPILSPGPGCSDQP